MNTFVPLLNIRSEKTQTKGLKKKLRRLNSELRPIQRKLSNQDFMGKSTKEAIKEVRKSGKVLKEQIKKINKIISVFVYK